MGILKVKKRQEASGEPDDVQDAVVSDESTTSEEEEEMEEIMEGSHAEEADTESTVDGPVKRRKVMILASRGVNARQRHLLDDLCLLLPHVKKESKFDTKKDLFALNELAELNGCSHTVFFEARKPQELFIWLSKCPGGPSARFHVQNIHTLEELHLTGNCMKGTRPVLTFDPYFEQASHGKMLKDLLSTTFGVPKEHKKTRPYIDHVIHFGWSDDRIWIRNYQIKEGDSTTPTAPPASNSKPASAVSIESIDGMNLEEIGPRLVLHPIVVLEKSFSGRSLWRNPNYVSLAALRASSRYGEAQKHKQRSKNREATVARQKNTVLPDNELDHVFDN